MIPLDIAPLLSPWGLALLGLVVGSFVNVVALRLPVMLERQWWAQAGAHLADGESHQRVFGLPPRPQLTQEAADTLAAAQALPALGLAWPGSRCTGCGHRIRWNENIPVLSWLMLRGRCSACASPISKRYPLTEAAMAALFAAIGWRFGPVPAALLWCAFAATLVALSAIDWDTTLLPDGITLPLLWSGVTLAALGWTGTPLAAAVGGAVAGYLSLWAVHHAFRLATGKEGMGQGDFKLLAALGAWLGWQALLPIVLMASVLGAAVGVAMKIAGTLREGRYVPFGPFLAGGALAVMFAGLPRVLAWMGW